MKVRILKESIRFRISVEELHLLALGKVVSDSINFPSGTITFSIVAQEGENHIDLINNNCHLILSKTHLLNLHQSDAVTISFSQDNLKVLFEKDFKCLTDREEDESSLFENPRTSH